MIQSNESLVDLQPYSIRRSRYVGFQTVAWSSFISLRQNDSCGKELGGKVRFVRFTNHFFFF